MAVPAGALDACEALRPTNGICILHEQFAAGHPLTGSFANSSWRSARCCVASTQSQPRRHDEDEEGDETNVADEERCVMFRCVGLATNSWSESLEMLIHSPDWIISIGHLFGDEVLGQIIAAYTSTAAATNTLARSCWRC
jgi:hypothetical protein